MTLNELLQKLSELKTSSAISGDAPVVLRLGVLKGIARKKIKDDHNPVLGTSVLTFTDDAIELEVEEPEGNPDDPPSLIIRGGPQLEMPPIL